MKDPLKKSHKKAINPVVKSVLEIGPVLFFFGAFLFLKGKEYRFGGVSYDGFIIATALLVPLMIVSTFLLWRLSGEVSRMQMMTVILVVIFGVMSVWFNDERFFKMKPTILYALFAVILLFGLLRGQSYLSFLIGDALSLSEEGWRLFTWRFVVFFIVMAVLNEIVWRGFSTGFWVSFKTFGAPLAMMGFFLSQFSLINRFKE